jgi:hypothetical protein
MLISRPNAAHCATVLRTLSQCLLADAGILAYQHYTTGSNFLEANHPGLKGNGPAGKLDPQSTCQDKKEPLHLE